MFVDTRVCVEYWTDTQHGRQIYTCIKQKEFVKVFFLQKCLAQILSAPHCALSAKTVSDTSSKKV
jgi:hypothetical protein